MPEGCSLAGKVAVVTEVRRRFRCPRKMQHSLEL